MKIVFLIRSLERGGAERQLVLLATGLHRAGHEVTVMTFYDRGGFSANLAASGVPVVPLGKAGRWDIVRFASRLIREIHRADPDLLHGYMLTGNLVASLARLFNRRVRIIWGVRSSTADPSRLNWLHRILLALEARLVRSAALVIANSTELLDRLRPFAGAGTGFSVIANGFDTDFFAPDAELRRKTRADLGIAAEETVVGFVGRVDPIKNHEVFLEAAQIALVRKSSLRFVCVGGGSRERIARLQEFSRQLGIADRIMWVEEQGDVRPFYNSFDLMTLSSNGEGFPNVVGEAMACGVPCIATDVGAAAEIVGDTGIIVPAGDAAALAAGWFAMLERLRGRESDVRNAVRLRIRGQFGADVLIDRSLAAFRSILPKAN